MRAARRAALPALGALLLLLSPAFAAPSLSVRIDQYLRTNDPEFSGAVLVTQNGGIAFDKAYGLADAEHHVPNQTSTSFHVGTLSRAFTAAMVLKLVDAQRLSLANTVVQFLPAIVGGDRITIASLLKNPQAHYGGVPVYTLLARVLEASQAKPLAEAMDADFFGPLFMQGSGLDDGTLGTQKRFAKGTTADGGPASAPDWAARLGDASAYTTTRDALRWLDGGSGDRLADAASHGLLGADIGGAPVFTLAGTAPGFAAFVARDSAHGISIILLANRDDSGLAAVGRGLAALAAEP